MVIAVSGTRSKVCKSCGEEKPLSEFSGCGVTPDRLQPNCKPCHEERKRAGKAAASEKRAAAVACAQQEVRSAYETHVAPPQPSGGSAAELGTPMLPKPGIDSPTPGVVTSEVVMTEVLRWQIGDRSMPIEGLGREELLVVARSLFEENARLRAESERELDEIAEAYEQKIHSLYHVLAAQVELDMREAIRDKMDVILEAVMAEVDRRSSVATGGHKVTNDSKEETTDEC